MRKGFLLPTSNKEKKRTQHCNVGDGKHAAKPRSKDTAELSMKRGFLLHSTPTAVMQDRKQHPLNGKKIAKENEDLAKAPPQPQSRNHDAKTVTAPSTALLGFEIATHETDNDAVVSPSLVNLIGSSVKSTSSFSNDPENISDHTHPLIIEQTDDNRPISAVKEVDATKDASSERKRNELIDSTNNVVESFEFANEVSQLLSKLRRAQKSKNKSKGEDIEGDYLSIGMSQFMNRKSEQLIKAFVEKYVQDSSVETDLRLKQIWTIILEHIAQDSTILSSRKKRKGGLVTNVSPHFVLGVGVLEFSSNVALESIADTLSELANAIIHPKGNDDEVKQKHYKTEVIGAILLIQCQFRCLRLETSDGQNFADDTTWLDGVEMECTILLRKVIPALQSIVVKEAKRTFLTAITSKTFFELIEIFPRVNAHTSSQLFWTEILPRVDTMLDMRRPWMTKERPTPVFCNVPYEFIIPPILEYLTKAHSTKTSYILCNIIKGNSEEDADNFVRYLISSMQHLDGCKSIFEKHGGHWKSYLLESDEGTLYKNILLATAKSMLDNPSSSVPLSLFSCFIGVTNDKEEKYPERKILLATISVVHFAINEVRNSTEFDTGDEEAVFRRISPLLVLRRLPKAYYEILHGQIESNTEDSRVIISDLAAVLASRFRAHALNDDEGMIAKEEKMLLAQVAGHCLPFSTSCDGGDVPISLFDLFEKPFSSTFDIMRASKKIPCCLQHVNESKLALFAICQHMPGAKNEEMCGTAFVRVASYIFDYLLHFQPACGEDEIDNEFAKLRTGCLHFLGVLFDTLFARKAKLLESMQIKLDGKINRDTFFDGLKITFEMASSILFNTTENERRFSVSTQTSILNAIIVYSQNCTKEDRRLELFASELLPALLIWLDHGTLCDDVHHPSCVAASLQVAYTMFARLGSFDWVTEFCEDSEADFLSLTFSCASKALYSEVSPLRQAALKVILTSVVCNYDLEKHLEPADIHYTLLAVRNVAYNDESEELRRLAMQIMPQLDT